jgi:hypothetical protein
MRTSALALLAAAALACGIPKVAAVLEAAPATASAATLTWPAGLPVYDHIVIVVEENKDYEQIIGNASAAYINGTLKAEGANLTRMYAEEHHSQGNYFWLFSGSNQGVGFHNTIPSTFFTMSNLGSQLIAAGRSFKGYSQGLPSIGSTVHQQGDYARKHVPWISFSNIPNGTTIATSSNLRFDDFPKDFRDLPTIAIVVPDLIHDMHNGSASQSIKIGDSWLRDNLDNYYQWAKTNNSLLIVTFDENDDDQSGLTNPASSNLAQRNRIATILAGAHIKSGSYDEGKGVTHVNLLRTLEAMYGLSKSGAQQPLALKAGITDDALITDVFKPAP